MPRSASESQMNQSSYRTKKVPYRGTAVMRFERITGSPDYLDLPERFEAGRLGRDIKRSCDTSAFHWRRLTTQAFAFSHPCSATSCTTL
jgi:hypothetical protein